MNNKKKWYIGAGVLALIIVLGVASFLIFDFQNDNNKKNSKKDETEKEIVLDTGVDQELEELAGEDQDSLTNTQLAGQSVNYSIEFVVDWSQQTHPENFPNDPHFSPFIAYSYTTTRNPVFSLNSVATPGLKEVAQTGELTLITSELENLLASDIIGDFTFGKRLDSPGFDSGVISVTPANSRFGFISMIGPSPDWFVTVADTNLFQDGLWRTEVELDLIGLDAGTDSGETYESDDLATDPQAQIARLDETYQKMGKVVLRLER